MQRFKTFLAAIAIVTILAEPSACFAAAAPEDTRLDRKVTLALKATALSDLCDQLQGETGIAFVAGRSVADEKVTLLCKEMPLREVMRQLARPFGYTWVRGGKEREYRYTLEQDLRSQLIEEETRRRDRNAALLALDQEMSQYRPYLDLSPDEALARAAKASPEEKQRLQRLAGTAWGAIQMYFRLSPEDMAALRAGQTVTFSTAPKPGERALPPALARGVLQSWREWRLQMTNGRLRHGTRDELPGGVPPAAYPEAAARVVLAIRHNDLGRFNLEAGSGYTASHSELAADGGKSSSSVASTITDNLALGSSPDVLQPANAVANARLARDAALQRRVTVAAGVRRQASGVRKESSEGKMPETDASRLTPDALSKVTSADVLEALHQATGMPFVGDYYTRLYEREKLAAVELPLFEALNQLADEMRLRWSKEGEWLQFRSTSFYDDRLKEVPNRLLARWATSRREHGRLTLEDLVEIAALAEAPLNSRDMAEGARLLWGLEEWELARHRSQREHLRYLAGLTPAQRQEAQSAAGLSFARMTLAQQQGFLRVAIGTAQRLQAHLADLAGATLRVQYLGPGEFGWAPPPAEGRPWQELLPAPVRERTREAALQAARRLDPRAAEAQIVPTETRLTILYATSLGPIRLVHVTPNRTRIITPDLKGSGFGENSSSH